MEQVWVLSVGMWCTWTTLVGGEQPFYRGLIYLTQFTWLHWFNKIMVSSKDTFLYLCLILS